MVWPASMRRVLAAMAPSSTVTRGHRLALGSPHRLLGDQHVPARHSRNRGVSHGKDLDMRPSLFNRS